MNSNLQNTSPAAVDPEKALTGEPLLTPPGLPNYYAVFQPGRGAIALPEDDLSQARRRNLRRRRFWHFTICAVFLLVFWQPIVSGVAHGVHRLSHLCAPRTPVEPMIRPQDCTDSVDWHLDSDGGYGHWRYHAQSSFALPLDAEELAFISDGLIAHGTFDVVRTGDVGSEAVVELDVHYRHSDDLDFAQVCHLRQGENKHGLGIFAHRWQDRRAEHQLRLNIRVLLPQTEDGTPRQIELFRTELPQFSQYLPELADSVFFKTLRLKSTNANIRADSVNGKSVSLRTNNAAIHGTFNTSSELELITNNAPIKFTANLHNSNANGTRVWAETRNGALQGNIGLFAESADGTFGVHAKTSNAPSSVSIFAAPPNSLLRATSETSNAPLTFYAPPAFEGRFGVRSSWFAAPAVEVREVQDPLGQGRRREVNTARRSRGEIVGEVDWKPKHEKAKAGSVNLETSNARATLVL